nr:polycystic kidney disease protein 1-like 3 [Globicephala melas]
MTSVVAHLSTTCHQPARATLSKTPRHSISPFPSIPPGVTQQGVSVMPVPTSQPLPVPPELTRPASVTHAGKAPVEITSSPKEDSHSRVSSPLIHKRHFTTHLIRWLSPFMDQRGRANPIIFVIPRKQSLNEGDWMSSSWVLRLLCRNYTACSSGMTCSSGVSPSWYVNCH